MSFWTATLGVAKNVGTVVVSAIAESANKIQETQSEYKDLSDDELIRVAKGEGMLGKTNQEKTIAKRELRNRGFSLEEIKKL